jgi:hypothetical protein
LELRFERLPAGRFAAARADTGVPVVDPLTDLVRDIPFGGAFELGVGERGPTDGETEGLAGPRRPGVLFGGGGFLIADDIADVWRCAV